MCGIAGCLGSNGGIAALATRMAGSLRHRGPDDSGVWSDAGQGIALSHRRLSIIDLSPEGHQPMLSADGRYVMAYNGEIYNHAALRREVEAFQPLRAMAVGQSSGGAGRSGETTAGWRGHSDTEVLLAAISAWGFEVALRKARGMFAIALWDRHERVLHLARDPLGEKPLYYAWAGGIFVFGSELKALRECPGFDREIDRGALALFLRHLYVPAPFTIHRGAHKLEAGCLLAIRLEGAACSPGERPLRAGYRAKELELKRWWSLGETVEEGMRSPITDERSALTLLETNLREVVREQAMADVPLGAFLSGGIDSSLIAALMKLEAGAAVKTFTIGLREKQHDEAEHATAVARHLGVDHTVLYVTGADALGVIPRVPQLYDEPFADASQIPTFLLCAQVRRHVTVALSGDGGDELFGGYNRHRWVSSIWKKVGWVPGPVRRGLAGSLEMVRPRDWDRVYRVIRGVLPARGRAAQPGDKLQKLARGLMRAHDENSFFLSLVSEWKDPAAVVIGADEPSTLLTQPGARPAFSTVEERMMYLDAMTYLPDDIMVKVDRAAMGVSLETRAPYLDRRVVELAARLPLGMKLRHGQGKWALRQILHKYVPAHLVERPKQGFGIPIADWLRGPLRDWAESLLAEERLRREGYFYPKPIRTKWAEHLSGSRNWEHSLWAVLMFQAWQESARTSS